jgi:predicted O-methyltransferase YrrM
VRLTREIVARFGRTPLGRRAMESMLFSDPNAALVGLGAKVSNEQTWDRVEDWPDGLHGFEDLAFLLSSNRANTGIASLMLNEAAYMYRLVRGLGRATIVEIGRFKGGSTFLLAAAMHPDARLVSYDPHVKLGREDADAPLRQALARYGLDRRTTLVVGDSKTAAPPDGPVDLVFVDGDHTYDAVKADHDRWTGLVRPGGHVLHHDALGEGYAVADPGSRRLVEELRRGADPRVRFEVGVGSIAHFVKLG